MAEGQTGQYTFSSKQRPVLKKQRGSVQLKISEDDRIHSQVFQDSTNLGKRSDLPSALNTKGCKPSKTLVAGKSRQAPSIPKEIQLQVESVSHRKPNMLAEASTQVSMPPDSDVRAQRDACLNKKSTSSRIDFKDDIFNHLLATDVREE